MKKFLVVIILVLALASCRKENPTPADPDPDPDPGSPLQEGLLDTTHFEYRGAFRLPAGDGSVASFAYGGWSMTYYPAGDSASQDSTPGSLYISGHAWEHRLAEVSIPEPVLSGAKNLSDLQRSSMLRNFKSVFPVADLEIPRVGLSYLPRQAGMNEDKLMLCWGYHMQEEPADLTHAWCRLDLTVFEGSWFLTGLPVYRQNMSTNDYMFTLPSAWSSVFAGRLLFTGRFRDGGWSGQGPALFALAPWESGNPPANGVALPNTALLLYDSTQETEGGATMTGYHHSDEWSGAAWVASATRQAILFCGTKGEGDCWYGNPDGPCLSCENRGWWSTRFKGVLLLYDIHDLVKVASGEMAPSTPQPYLSIPVDDRLFSLSSVQQKHHLGACAFDSDHQLLYVLEPFADDDQPIVHVWGVRNDS